MFANPNHLIIQLASLALSKDCIQSFLKKKKKKKKKDAEAGGSFVHAQNIFDLIVTKRSVLAE